MSARRKAIRKGMQKVLLDKTDAGGKIYTNLSSAIWDSDLPQVIIYPRSEEVTELNVAPREYKRTLQMAVEVVASGPEGSHPDDGKPVEDVLDDIADQVERELNRDERLGIFTYTDGDGNEKSEALVDELILSSVEFEFDEGKDSIGSARLVYSATYYEFRPQSLVEQGITNDFTGADTTWNVDKREGDEASDTVNVPTV